MLFEYINNIWEKKKIRKKIIIFKFFFLCVVNCLVWKDLSTSNIKTTIPSNFKKIILN